MNETRSIWAVVADNREEAELLKLRSNLIIKISDHIKSLNVNLIEVSMLYNIKEKRLNVLTILCQKTSCVLSNQAY